MEIVPAVDTREGRWQMYKHHLTRDALAQVERVIRDTYRLEHHELTPGAIGCFLSHIKCWQQFLDRYGQDADDKYVFILEDDSIPQETFEPMLRKVLTHMPKDADIVLFSHIKSGPQEEVEVANDLKLIRMKKGSIFYLLNAYLIKGGAIRKIMKHLAEHGMKFNKQVDSYMTDLMNMGVVNVYTTTDSVCPQVYVTDTSIQTIRMF